VQLAAADSLDAFAHGLTAVMAEYHAEVERLDDEREHQVVAAFIARVRADAADDAKISAHADAFLTAMKHLRADRQVQWHRHAATAENLGLLRETAEGLRRIAMESLSLHDETRRYFEQTLKQQHVGRVHRPDTAGEQGRVAHPFRGGEAILRGATPGASQNTLVRESFLASPARQENR